MIQQLEKENAELKKKLSKFENNKQLQRTNSFHNSKSRTSNATKKSITPTEKITNKPKSKLIPEEKKKSNKIVIEDTDKKENLNNTMLSNPRLSTFAHPSFSTKKEFGKVKHFSSFSNTSNVLDITSNTSANNSTFSSLFSSSKSSPSKLNESIQTENYLNSFRTLLAPKEKLPGSTIKFAPKGSRLRGKLRATISNKENEKNFFIKSPQSILKNKKVVSFANNQTQDSKFELPKSLEPHSILKPTNKKRQSTMISEKYVSDFSHSENPRFSISQFPSFRSGTNWELPIRVETPNKNKKKSRYI